MLACFHCEKDLKRQLGEESGVCVQVGTAASFAALLEGYLARNETTVLSHAYAVAQVRSMREQYDGKGTGEIVCNATMRLSNDAWRRGVVGLLSS
jgi:hypothetical protein